jgi:curved DNA-binding protein CbpA
MTAAHPDPYTVLGVPPTATAQEINRAYRRLLRSHHPDTGAAAPSSADPGDGPVSLREVVEAYAVLRDPVTRAQHDRNRRPAAAPRAAPRRTVHVDVRVDPGGTLPEEPQIRVGPVLWRPGSAHGRA